MLISTARRARSALDHDLTGDMKPKLSQPKQGLLFAFNTNGYPATETGCRIGDDLRRQIDNRLRKGETFDVLASIVCIVVDDL